MPELSDTEVLIRIRALDINAAVVIMTAFATVKNEVECTRLGAVAYLQKPFTAEKVKSLLEEIELHEDSDKNIIKQYLTAAKASIEKSQLDEALNTLKKALSVDIECGDVYYLIGKVYELKGFLKESDTFYNMSKQFLGSRTE